MEIICFLIYKAILTELALQLEGTMKIRVMVVEDEPPIQRSICQKIEETNKNFTVVAAIDNGKDALQYLKEHPVDVMFVDMNLPIVGGKELLDFCSNEELSVLPVVLSGYTDFE